MGLAPKVLPGPLTSFASTAAGAVRRLRVLHLRGPGLICKEIALMAHRIRRAWHFVLAVTPISAIVLVEAAMRRW